MKRWVTSVLIYTKNALFAEAVTVAASERSIQVRQLNRYAEELNDLGEKIIVDAELLDEVKTYKGIKCAVVKDPICDADEVYPMSILAIPSMLTVTASGSKGSVRGVRRTKKNIMAEVRELRQKKAIFVSGKDMMDFNNKDYIVCGRALWLTLAEEEYLLHYAFGEKVRYGRQTKQRLIRRYGEETIERMLICLREGM